MRIEAIGWPFKNERNVAVIRKEGEIRSYKVILLPASFRA